MKAEAPSIREAISKSLRTLRPRFRIGASRPCIPVMQTRCGAPWRRMRLVPMVQATHFGEDHDGPFRRCLDASGRERILSGPEAATVAVLLP